MNRPAHVLLVNPTITKARNARFPLAILNLAAALEGTYSTTLIDGNVDRDFLATTVRTVGQRRPRAVGLSVMGGPQLRYAIAASKAIRLVSPATAIVWGGHFPSICADAAVSTEFVDYAVRGQGEATILQLLDALGADDHPGDAQLRLIPGLSWRSAQGIVHNEDRTFASAALARELPYEQLGNPRRYLARTFLGARTAGFQAALGCRFRCTFCGVAAMFRGRTALPTALRLDEQLQQLKQQFGADSIQFYDHNFFDREVAMEPLLEVLARHELPWWCFARSDALVNLTGRSWGQIRKSRLRMAYIGAESPDDRMLHDIRKGTRSEQTLAAVETCLGHDVIPELSFMLAPPDQPEEQTERTFDFIRLVKRRHPRTEIMIYLYTPLPPRPVNADQAVVRTASELRDVRGNPVVFPQTATQWALPQWQAYWCHTDAPWVSERLRRRITDFTTVLGCRFPTVTDIRSAGWQKRTLRALAYWRYRSKRYDAPWELDLSKKFIRLRDPRVSSL